MTAAHIITTLTQFDLYSLLGSKEIGIQFDASEGAIQQAEVNGNDLEIFQIQCTIIMYN